MNIDQILDQYKSMEELKIFVGIQMKQIQTLTKKNKELQDKLDNAGKLPTELPVDFKVSKEDAKTISEIQLFLLKQEAMKRELNTDEAKRVELYNRILKEAGANKKPGEVDPSELPLGELLKLV